MYGLYGLKHHIVEISADVTRRDGRTNERTRKDNATQPFDAGRLSFAIRAGKQRYLHRFDSQKSICNMC